MEENPRIVCQKRIDEILLSAQIQAMAYVRAEVQRIFEQRPSYKRFSFRRSYDLGICDFHDAHGGMTEWDAVTSDLTEFIDENYRLLQPEFSIERKQP